jgi:hypothetical protein
VAISLSLTELLTVDNATTIGRTLVEIREHLLRCAEGL